MNPCNGCKHFARSIEMEPCLSCNDGLNWQADDNITALIEAAEKKGFEGGFTFWRGKDEADSVVINNAFKIYKNYNP